MIDESREGKLLNAIFGGEPHPKSLRFSLALEDVIVDVSVRRARKAGDGKCCGCRKDCPCKGGGKK